LPRLGSAPWKSWRKPFFGNEYISGNIELLKSKHHFFIYTVTFVDVWDAPH
jgi:hypothetical protein